MATFEVTVVQLEIEPHPNADKLELAKIGDYRSVVGKDQFKTGDLGIYIPEQSVLPTWLIEKLGLVGKLAGKQKNRVKAVKLRGIVSQGLVYPVTMPAGGRTGPYQADCVVEYEGIVGSEDLTGRRIPLRSMVCLNIGDDATKFLGITKYEPPIPVHMAGEVETAHGYTINYDIENLKRYPDVLQDGEEVVLTEKLHGTWSCFGYHPDVGRIVTSKGLSKQGLIFKDNDANKENLYIRAFNELMQRLNYSDVASLAFTDPATNEVTPTYILGEVFGCGVQDLHYGQTKPTFRAFDVYVGKPGEGKYLDEDQKMLYLHSRFIERVPVLYRGPYSKEVIAQYTDGKETLSGQSANVREGVVITPTVERRDPTLGRVILKSVSNDYIFRDDKNATEYN